MKTKRIYSIEDMANLLNLTRGRINQFLDGRRYGMYPDIVDGTGRRYFSETRALRIKELYLMQKAAGPRRRLSFRISPAPMDPGAAPLSRERADCPEGPGPPEGPPSPPL